MVGYYYDSLVYAYLTKKQQETKTYGERRMYVATGMFPKMADELLEKVVDKAGNDSKI